MAKENNKNIADIKQLQADLLQEKFDNQENQEEKKKALTAIISDYNNKYGTSHSITDFDLYYQDIQERIKYQKYPNKDYARQKKIDIVIVVDMLLTWFDSKYLNTLYVDKNLKHHGLIQAFSRTNRVLNDTKPWGNILDFRNQEEAVNEAIALFSGKDTEKAKQIWLVDSAPVVIGKYETAIKKLEVFMKSQGLNPAPEEVVNLNGDNARAEFVNYFKEVQRLKTKIEQYTNLKEEEKSKIEEILPEDTLISFKSMYLETAKKLKVKQDQGKDLDDNIQQLDFEFVLFSSALIDYDYIMTLISKYTQRTDKQKMTKAELISMISSSSNLMDDREDIIGYLDTLKIGDKIDEKDIRSEYLEFKNNKLNRELSNIAEKHGLTSESLKDFVDRIINRMIFDGESLNDLLAPLDLGWKARTKKELELMEDLIPILKKFAKGQEISGLKAYE